MRKQDWPERMDRWIQENSARPFSWGAWDCALMAAAHIDNLTGSSIYDTHCGRYGTDEEAQGYLKENGLDGLEALANSVLGKKLPTVKKAQRGDVVLFDTDNGPALGVVTMCGMRLIGTGPDGFRILPLRLATAAWRV